jgi:TRAP-type C4-dicarboxylate transport system permease small subunit
MSTTTASTTTSFPSPVINLLLGLCFIGCCVGFTIQGYNVWTTTHKWGMMAGGIAFGLVGLIALIRQLVFFVRAEQDQLVFLVNFDSKSLPWSIPAIILAVVGIVLMIAF